MTAKLPTYLCFILLITILCGALEGKAESLTVEYKVKAGFLFNFFNFVTWPTGPPADTDPPLKLCLVADGLASRTISEQINGRRIAGRPLQVSRNSNIQDLGSCQMIFISAARSGLQRKVLAAVDGKSILTIGENRDFASVGGVINFTRENNRIRLQINQTAAKRAHLKISSKLLRVAKTVINDKAAEETK